MLFRRLSERVRVECDNEAVTDAAGEFVALYVNANDFADAFARFPVNPSIEDEQRLICYANLCVLGDILTIQSARVGRGRDGPNEALSDLVDDWLAPGERPSLVVGEDRLERQRSVIEKIKWTFAYGEIEFPGFASFSQHRWLPHLIRETRTRCNWLGDTTVLLFIDDYSSPRVTSSMQRVLNRVFFQRSAEVLSKIATESSTTFVPEDSSGKTLEDGDDFQLVDIGEEALFLPDSERKAFLGEVFARRLPSDSRIATSARTVGELLGRNNLSKTEFARKLRLSLADQSSESRVAVTGRSQRRGRSRARVYYFGEDVFVSMWSGDTRNSIQLISDIIDQTADASRTTAGDGTLDMPVDEAIQDRAFRNRGGEWLTSHTRNEPSDPESVRLGIERLQESNSSYALRGRYGEHLKSIVEAFVAAAKHLLLGAMYTIGDGEGRRQVPRMAFRIEIVDEFRLEGLAQEIYRDLIRYGLFMRDSRGKSVRGAFVPRLYLRRLLLPYCTLALSKRDSVALTREKFVQLLLEPGRFQEEFVSRRGAGSQLAMQFSAAADVEVEDLYDDLSDDCGGVQ